jgi:phosphoglycerate dehydrogenase-like enzyme
MYPPGKAHLARLREAAPGASFVVASDEDTARREIADADAVLGNRYFTQSVAAARRLRWMQSNSMGVDLILERLGTGLPFVLTCARGVYDGEVAEHAVALLLSLVRGLHLARDRQALARWERSELATVSGSRVLVLGWGGVGRAIGRRLAGLGATVVPARRTSRGAEGEHALGAESWRGALPTVAALVMALPLVPATRGAVGERELSALPPGAWLVNVGRGATLDEDALLAALRSGRLAGAALDVFASEPLAVDSPLWREPRLVVSPHVARSAERGRRRWEGLFEENLRRFAAGETLLNVVEPERGY